MTSEKTATGSRQRQLKNEIFSAGIICTFGPKHACFLLTAAHWRRIAGRQVKHIEFGRPNRGKLASLIRFLHSTATDQTRPDPTRPESVRFACANSQIWFIRRATPTSFKQIDLFSRIHRQCNVITFRPSCTSPLSNGACDDLIARKTKQSKPVVNKDHYCDNPFRQSSSVSFLFDFCYCFCFELLLVSDVFYRADRLWLIVLHVIKILIDPKIL